MKIDLLATVGGVVYGVLLVLVVFVKTRFTESLRIDSLIIPNSSEKTRPINLIAGVCFAGYSIYSMF